MEFRKTRYEYVNWIQIAQGRVQWKPSNEHLDAIKVADFSTS
jgi:hypothetical protein